MIGVPTAVLCCLQLAQAAGLTVDGGARNPAYGPDGRLAIEMRGDLWVSRASAGPGAEWVRITSGAAWDRDPVWTTDGAALVFSSDRSGNFDLWRVTLTPGAEPQRITASIETDAEPSAGSDGSIVFVRGHAAEWHLWIRTADGTERRLTNGAAADHSPAISGDARHVVYVSDRRLHIIASDGSGDRILVPDRDAEYPAWSPAGDRIAFSGVGTRPSVWVTTPDAAYVNLVALTRGALAWSPDGAFLAVAEMPLEAGGSYNGDPDRLGDRDVGDLAPSEGRLSLIRAPLPPDAVMADVPVHAEISRASLNAEAFDQFVQRTTRLYFSGIDAVDRRAQWERVAAKYRSRAVGANTDDELRDAMYAALRERPTLRAPAEGNAAVSSAHPVATAAGLEILRKGGNAIDAAVAVSFALGVVEPDASGLGGYGQMLVYKAGMDRPTLIEFMTTVPESASVLNAAYPPGGRFPADGPLLANVPGTVKGMETAWKKYGSGKVAWADLVAPAIRAAENGFVVSDGLATTLEVERDAFSKYPSSLALYFRDGHPVEAGDTIRNPDLAWALREIASGGAAALYGGSVGQKMVADLAAQGHAMRLSDLTRYTAPEREPVHGTFRGNDVYSSAPPVSGGATLIAELNTLEQFAAPRDYRDDAASLHAVIEAWNLAPRGARINDPDLWPVSLEPNVNKDSARARWACFSANRAVRPSEIPACVRSGASGERRGDGRAGGDSRGPDATPAVNLAERGDWTADCEPDERRQDGVCRSTGTTAFVVADAAGDVVAATQTLGTWGGNFYVAPGLGFIYNDKVRSYTAGADPATPGARVAGARHGSTLAPTIVFRGAGVARRPWIALGAAGNNWITSAVYQSLVGMVDGKLDPQHALELPRFQVTTRGAGTQREFVVQMEDDVAPSVIRALESMGHQFQFISLTGELRQGYGAALTIDRGRVTAGADPRRSGTAGALTCDPAGRRGCSP